jgi:hypothetical protein
MSFWERPNLDEEISRAGHHLSPHSPTPGASRGTRGGLPEDWAVAFKVSPESKDPRLDRDAGDARVAGVHVPAGNEIL